jgi:O-antigen ligase
MLLLIYLIFFYLDIWRYGKPSPHNLFLHYWSENGIIGFLLSISLFLLFFYYSFKTIKLSKEKNKEYYIVTLAITGIGIGLLFRAFFEVTGLLYYGFITTDLPFWLVFGILIYIYQKLISNRYNIVE